MNQETTRSASLRAGNRYTYVRNNPLKYTDPSGRVCSYIGEYDSCADVRGDYTSSYFGFAVNNYLNGYSDGPSFFIGKRKKPSYMPAANTITPEPAPTPFPEVPQVPIVKTGPTDTANDSNIWSLAETIRPIKDDRPNIIDANNGGGGIFNSSDVIIVTDSGDVFYG